jgi:signal peptidase I
MRLLRYLFGTLTATLIAVGVALPLATHVAPLFGYELLAVRGRSMEPTIAFGSLILVERREAGELGVGEAITWEGQNGVWVTHRIVDVIDGDGVRQFQTQGDASNAPDGALISENLVVGSVSFTIPAAGYALLMLSTPSGLISWLSFGLAVLLADALVAGEVTKAAPTPARRRPGHNLLRLATRDRSVPEPAWPIHFTGVTILGDDPMLIADMVRCSEGDHRACRTDASPRTGVTGVRDWAKAA